MRTAARYAAQPDWLFMKIEAKGPSVALSLIDIGCNPGTTAGPVERERS